MYARMRVCMLMCGPHSEAGCFRVFRGGLRCSPGDVDDVRKRALIGRFDEGPSLVEALALIPAPEREDGLGAVGAPPHAAELQSRRHKRLAVRVSAEVDGDLSTVLDGLADTRTPGGRSHRARAWSEDLGVVPQREVAGGRAFDGVEAGQEHLSEERGWWVSTSTENRA